MTERLPLPDTKRFPALQSNHIRVLPTGHLLGRIHSQAGSHPTTWDEFRRYGPTTARFDHQPLPRGTHATRAVLYAAPQLSHKGTVSLPLLRTCVAEVFRDRGVIEMGRNCPYFVLFKTVRELRLLDVIDSDWVTLAGGNGAISAGLRSASREWARAVYRHYKGADRLDGIFYGCANIPPARSILLFEHAKNTMPAKPEVHLPLTHPALRAELEHYANELGLDLL